MRSSVSKLFSLGFVLIWTAMALALLPSWARGASEPSPSATTIASDANTIRHPAENRACAARVAAFQGRACDLIFIGDSITQSWESVGKKAWADHFARHRALNFGVSGDRTENVLWRLDHLPVSSLRPKVAVILIGTNNVQSSPVEIAQGVEAVTVRTQQIFPGAAVILVSILPNARSGAKMEATNALIHAWAEARNVLYLDLAAKFTPVGDTWKGLGPDRLHPDSEGYEIWADSLAPLLAPRL